MSSLRRLGSRFCFFFNDTATTEIYTLSLHDALPIYVMWEVMLIPMYFIIGVWGGERRLYAAIKFFIYTFFGSLLMLVAILVLVSLVGHLTGVYSFSYAYLTAHLGGLGPAAFWLFGAFFLAFAIKVPMFPFHTWLPDAHVEAP